MNIILDTDSYKLSHWAMYPPDLQGLSCYVECRKPMTQCVFAGVQPWIDEYLTKPVSMADVEFAERFAHVHGVPFNRAGWELVVSRHAGLLPIDVFSVDEGTPVPSGHALAVVECAAEGLAWLATYVETSFLRYVWYMSSVATRGREAKRMMLRFWEDTCDDLDGLDFALHDFGSRGCPAAAMGGAAHLFNYRGSDTIAGVLYAGHHYDEPMAAHSVAASEHSVHMAWGQAKTHQYAQHVLDVYAKPHQIVSVVVDAYNDAACAMEVLRRGMIPINDGATVVVRPDSGIPWLKVADMLEMAWQVIGGDYNQRGFKVLRRCKVLQGDGITRNVMYQVLSRVKELGFAASNVVFGSGGWLLQDHTRDDLGWAYKASAKLVGGRWERMQKTPSGDPGKASKGGRLLTCHHPEHGWRTSDAENWAGLGAPGMTWKNMMRQRYRRGEVMNRTTLAQIRERSKL